MRNIYKAKRDYILQVLEPYSDQIDIYGMVFAERHRCQETMRMSMGMFILI